MTMNATKKAMISSLISLFLCIAMLVGTTYAWFTESVTSTNNIIKSGSLDMELEYFTNGEWKPVNENTNVFMENALWEPGHTEVVYLKISNKGSLTFNYKLSVNVAEETKSINVNGDELVLSNYIYMGALEDQSTTFAGRTDAMEALSNSNAPINAIKAGYAADGTLYPSNNEGRVSEKYVALVVYMPETIGNEANHKPDKAVPTIKLGLNVLATQAVYEVDGFDDQYDAGANSATPPVPMAPMTIDLTVYDVFDANMQQTTLSNVTLNIYEFIAEQYLEAYPLETYKDWTCDFFVSTDSAVEEGLILAGNYGTFGWLGFWVPENDEAYDPVGLLGVVSHGGESNWTYQDIHDGVQIFRCGLIDYEGNNTGVKVTVDLRMKSPDGTQNITVRSITVTLGPDQNLNQNQNQNQ